MEREKLVALVSAAQKGDAEALNALFNAYYHDVYYFALKTVKDSELACDITQDTFVKIIGSLGELKEPAAFVVWMKQITYNECCRYFKKKKEILVDEDEDGNTVFDILAEDRTDFIPHEALDQEDFRKTILSMLDRLSEEQRSAVLLYYYDEFSVGQIARIQGVSEGTVKSRLNYARKAIKTSVEAYEKKHNVKLHSFGFAPFVLWLLASSEEGMPAAAAAGVASAVSASTGTALAVSSGAAATTAATAAATGASAAISPLLVKVAAVVVAATVTVGGVMVAVKPKEPEPPITPNHSMQQQEEEPESSQETQEEGVSENLEPPATEEDPTEETEEAVNTQPPEAPEEEIPETTEEEPTEPAETGETVADGCTYILADGTILQPGESMPETVGVGDQYVTPEYTYGYYYSGGWGVRVNDTAKASYGPLLASVNGVPVTDLSNCFSGCANMISAPAIPAAVTDLFSAFQGCASLQTAPAIPGGVTVMAQTFYGCSSLTQAPAIPAGVQVVYGLFQGCASLTQAPELPAGITDLSSTFRFCASLQVPPSIPAGVTNLDYTFQGCGSLQTAPALPAGVTSMNQTFAGCSSLTAPPALPGGVMNLNSAFSGCSSLAYAPAIPAGVTNMYGLFFNCYALTGQVVIHANPASYGECFLGTIGPITLTGSSAMLEQIAATAPAGNVTVG